MNSNIIQLAVLFTLLLTACGSHSEEHEHGANELPAIKIKMIYPQELEFQRGLRFYRKAQTLKVRMNCQIMN